MWTAIIVLHVYLLMEDDSIFIIYSKKQTFKFTFLAKSVMQRLCIQHLIYSMYKNTDIQPALANL